MGNVEIIDFIDIHWLLVLTLLLTVVIVYLGVRE